MAVAKNGIAILRNGIAILWNGIAILWNGIAIFGVSRWGDLQRQFNELILNT